MDFLEIFDPGDIWWESWCYFDGCPGDIWSCPGDF